MPSGSEHSVPSASLSSVAEPAPATAPSTPNAADAHASDAVMRAMSQMPAMLAYWDKDLRCRYANEAYLGWFGRTAAEMQGIGMRELLGPLYELNRPYIEGALTGVPQEFERRIPLPAGGFRDSLATYTPDIIDGQVAGFVAHVSDVTGVKERLNRLREADEQVRLEALQRAQVEQIVALVNRLRVGLLVINAQGEIVLSNPAAAVLLGQSPEALRGRSWVDPIWTVFHEDGTPFPSAERPVPTSIRTGQPVRDVIMGLAREGNPQPVWLLVDAEPELGADGAVTEVVVTFVEVTDLRRMERELAQANARLAEAVDAGGVGLWDLVPSTGMVTLSGPWTHLVTPIAGSDRALLSDWLARVHPDDVQRLQQELEACLRGHTATFQSSLRFRQRDETYRQLLARGTAVMDASGQCVRLHGSVLDLTERTELENRLQQAQKLESVGRLAGGIAHDFNNILTIVNTTAELALRGATLDDDLRQDLEEIRHAGARAARLTAQLLAFSRKQILAASDIPLHGLLAEMRTMLTRLLHANITLQLDLTPDDVVVHADRGQLEQVLMNLAINAGEAMPDGGVLTISTRIASAGDVESTAGGDAARNGGAGHVILQVTDTGVGMDEVTRRSIFEPFFTTKRTATGTGLGLATVFGVIQQSGGTISVDSAPGAGTVFTITLPRVRVAEPGARVEAGDAPARGHETILVVEDEDGVRALERKILTAAGYIVLTANGGSPALSTIDAHFGPIDLLVTDVVMPGMNGRELATAVQTQRPGTRVLFTSGYTDDAILRHGVLDEATHFLAKPFSRDELLSKVRVVLDESITDG